MRAAKSPPARPASFEMHGCNSINCPTESNIYLYIYLYLSRCLSTDCPLSRAPRFHGLYVEHKRALLSRMFTGSFRPCSARATLTAVLFTQCAPRRVSNRPTTGRLGGLNSAPAFGTKENTKGCLSPLITFFGASLSIFSSGAQRREDLRAPRVVFGFIASATGARSKGGAPCFIILLTRAPFSFRVSVFYDPHRAPGRCRSPRTGRIFRDAQKENGRPIEWKALALVSRPHLFHAPGLRPTREPRNPLVPCSIPPELSTGAIISLYKAKTTRIPIRSALIDPFESALADYKRNGGDALPAGSLSLAFRDETSTVPTRGERSINPVRVQQSRATSIGGKIR